MRPPKCFWIAGIFASVKIYLLVLMPPGFLFSFCLIFLWWNWQQESQSLATARMLSSALSGLLGIPIKRTCLNNLQSGSSPLRQGAKFAQYEATCSYVIGWHQPTHSDARLRKMNLTWCLVTVAFWYKGNRIRLGWRAEWMGGSRNGCLDTDSFA